MYSLPAYHSAADQPKHLRSCFAVFSYKANVASK